MERTTACEHKDYQRTLTGTWCMLELEEAVHPGYQIIKVHEVWHFLTSQTGLFADYVNTWLKLKEEANGFPADCTNAEQCTDHVAAYATREGIALNPTNMEKNNGQRALAKLMLNSMWGKFGQRTKKSSHLRQRFDRVTRRNSILPRGRGPFTLGQFEHLCGALHDVPCSPPIVRSPTSPARTSVVLRHRFRDLHPATQ